MIELQNLPLFSATFCAVIVPAHMFYDYLVFSGPFLMSSSICAYPLIAVTQHVLHWLSMYVKCLVAYMHTHTHTHTCTHAHMHAHTHTHTGHAPCLDKPIFEDSCYAGQSGALIWNSPQSCSGMERYEVLYTKAMCSTPDAPVERVNLTNETTIFMSSSSDVYCIQVRAVISENCFSRNSTCAQVASLKGMNCMHNVNVLFSVNLIWTAWYYPFMSLLISNMNNNHSLA